MENIEMNLKKEECCGCTACYSVCPVNAIQMQENEEGFLYPQINEKLCISCKKCVTVCDFKNNKKEINKNPVVYAAKHNNIEIRLNSRSGGAFTALTDPILKNGGVIYGCVLDEKNNVIHKRAETFEERDQFRGSKYVQSDLKETFREAKNDLENGKEVVFSGTSCQIAGLNNFLSDKVKENLYTIDILCMGVPSPLIWKDYVKFVEKKYRGKVESVDFRNKKKFGWKWQVETLKINGKEIDKTNYAKLFYSHCTLRPSCYQCPYKSVYHPGDITLGDFWGIERVDALFNDNKGVSLVLINTKKGERWFQEIEDDMKILNATIEECMQPVLQKSVSYPEKREKFWRDYEQHGIKYIIKKYADDTLEVKLKNIVKKILRREIV